MSRLRNYAVLDRRFQSWAVRMSLLQVVNNSVISILWLVTTRVSARKWDHRLERIPFAYRDNPGLVRIFDCDKNSDLSMNTLIAERPLNRQLTE